MPNVPDDHAGHDTLLISAYVAGDVDAAEREAAERQLADCPTCASLAAELRAIAAALPTSAIPDRPRDFRLSADTAERARNGLRFGWLRGDRILTALRPAGAALATLGLAGLLLGATANLGGAGATVLSTIGNSITSEAGGDTRYAQPAASSAPLAAASAPAPGAGSGAGSGGSSGSGAQAPNAGSSGGPSAAPSGAPVAAPAQGGTADKSTETAGPQPAPAAPPGPSPLAVVSIAALGVGIVLLAASVVVRSRAEDRA
jgi:hypothetical protein